MKKTIYSIATFLLLAVVFIACEDDRPDTTGSVSGFVRDRATGNPLHLTTVLLNPGGVQRVTGTDGQFYFTELKAGDYVLTVNQATYRELNHPVRVIAGENAEVNFLLERLPDALRIVGSTNPPVDIDSLAFGSGGITTRTFFILNDGPEILNWVIENNSEWINNLSSTSGSILPNSSLPIGVTIDRNKLAEGKNDYLLNIKSNSGNAELRITAVGEHRIFPTLRTLSVTNITASSATLNGEILTAGTPAYTERGFVFSTSSMPTIEQEEVVRVVVAQTAYFSASISGLISGQTYFVRAYAISPLGTVYSPNQVYFIPQIVLPTVTTQAVSNINIASSTATFNGTIVNVGDPAYTVRGFVFGTTPNPTSADRKEIASGSEVAGVFSLTVSNIQEGFTYYVRAFATNAHGTKYSPDYISFNFIATTMPVVTTQAVTSINTANGTAIFNGTLVSSGDWPIFERGFVFGSSPNPTIADRKEIVSGSEVAGAFSRAVSNIQEKTTYFVRAFVTNANGTVYGNQESFFTGIPTCNLNTPGWGNSLGTITRGGERIIVGNGIVQVWSDHVMANACNKTTFNGGPANPFNADCRRSHAIDRSHPGYGDLFSWCAVMRFSEQLCPYPWRVPTRQDFINLDIALGGGGTNMSNATLRDRYLNVWGGVFGGRSNVDGQLVSQAIPPNIGGTAFYWASTQATPTSTSAHSLSFSSGGGTNVSPQTARNKFEGLALRCVRDGGSCNSGNPPNINIHPSTGTQIRARNQTFSTLTVTATGTSPFTYQWFSNIRNDNTSGTAIPGATNASFTPPSTSDGALYYYVIITNYCGSTASNVSGRHIVTTNCNFSTPLFTGGSLGTISYGSATNTNISTNTTTVSNGTITQVWSSPVFASNCNKTTFNGGSATSSNADCRRSHASNRNFPGAGDLFSWCAVMRFADQLCPSPWRVPTIQDFVNLNTAMGGSGSGDSFWSSLTNFIGTGTNQWAGVLAGASLQTGALSEQGRIGYYWSSQMDREGDATRATILHIDSTPQGLGALVSLGWGAKNVGMLLRCVRDN